jgi:hypothetical protein
MPQENDVAELRAEIGDLSEQVKEIKRMIMALAPTIALNLGDASISHEYLRRILAIIGNRSEKQMWLEAHTGREFAREAEQALDLMAERCRELDASDLADYLLR